MEAIKAVYRKHTAKWASSAIAVPKPGTEQLRFTVDLVAVNALTVPIQSSLPHLESTLQNCEGSKHFANIDFSHGFWQIPLSKEIQEVMSIQTGSGVYSPTRTLQGRADSATYFQDETSEKFQGRVDKMLQWIDDFLLYSKSEQELLEIMEIFFTVCEEANFRVNAKKSNFYVNEAKFCGEFCQIRENDLTLGTLVH